MSDLDFSSTSPSKPPAQPAAPPPPPVYNAAIAMEFFKSAGKPESFAAGATLFSEDEKGGLFKSPKMYVLILGEIEMIAQNQVIGSVKAGETFGEMAVIAQAPRSQDSSLSRPSLAAFGRLAIDPPWTVHDRRSLVPCLPVYREEKCTDSGLAVARACKLIHARSLTESADCSSYVPCAASTGRT